MKYSDNEEIIGTVEQRLTVDEALELGIDRVEADELSIEQD